MTTSSEKLAMQFVHAVALACEHNKWFRTELQTMATTEQLKAIYNAPFNLFGSLNKDFMRAADTLAGIAHACPDDELGKILRSVLKPVALDKIVLEHLHSAAPAFALLVKNAR